MEWLHLTIAHRKWSLSLALFSLPVWVSVSASVSVLVVAVAEEVEGLQVAEVAEGLSFWSSECWSQVLAQGSP